MVKISGDFRSGMRNGDGSGSPAGSRKLDGGSGTGVGGYFWPWLIFLWILSVLCYMALWMAWKIFTDIEKDKAFTMENAKRMGNVSFLAAADAVLLIVGNVVYLILHMNHPGVLLASFLIALVGTAIAIAAAMLSHLIRKAARLQDESDWTI